ncbi:unnamed protein product [Rotaria sp. Silwood2]|nr:unnamed protein product [Rotaria sp. Silwood2]
MIMVKLLFIVLIGFLNIYYVTNLSCMSNDIFTISRNEILSSNGLFTLEKFSNKTTNSTIKNNICYVKILIDYDQIDGYVTIQFKQNINYTVNKLTFETSFLFNEYNDSIINSIEYSCSSDDLCDKKFINRWIRWIIDINYVQLKNQFINITTFDIQSNRCYIVSGKITECSNFMCSNNYKTILNYKDCLSNQLIITKSLYIKMESIDLQNLKYEKLVYSCMSEKCLNERIFNYIWEKSLFLFHGTNFIVSSIDYTNRVNSLLASSSKNHLISMKGQSNNYIIAYIQNYSTNPIVLICFFTMVLFIICCCWCCSCLCSTTSKQCLETVEKS